MRRRNSPRHALEMNRNNRTIPGGAGPSAKTKSPGGSLRAGRAETQRLLCGGFSLAEVMAALSLTALLAVVGARSLIPAPAADTEGVISCETVALQLTRLRRLAILHGTPQRDPVRPAARNDFRIRCGQEKRLQCDRPHR